MIHGKEIVSFALYLCRYEQCEDMRSLPIYCETCIEREGKFTSTRIISSLKKRG